MSAAIRTALAAASPTPEERPPFVSETPFPQPVRLRLRKHVLALDYAQCSDLLRRLLERLGYEDVRIAGRTTLHGYNRPGGGGWDLTATLPAGVGSRRVIVRLKHAPRQHHEPEPKPVHQRCVDELRGACLRAGAAEGLLVTTGEFSLTARRLSGQEHRTLPVGVAPVRLVDGEEVVELLLHHRLGVREVFVFPGKRRLEIDETFFQKLQGKGDPRVPTAPAKAAATCKGATPRFSAWHVSVRLINGRPDTAAGRGTRGRRTGGRRTGRQ